MSGESAAQFSEKVETIVKNGVTTVAFSIGAQMGFFDVMATFEDAFTPEELASKTNCKPVFAKQWLLIMAASDIVDMCSPEADSFCLPVHRREVIASPFSPINSRAKYVSAFGGAEGELMECMKVGCEKKMSAWLRDMLRGDRVRPLKAQIPLIIASVPGLETLLESGASVLDVGSNRGELLLFLAAKYPKSNFTGIDPAKVDTDFAVEAAKTQGLTNVTFLPEDALEMPKDWTEKFDYIVSINTLHHLPDGIRGASEMKRVLKTGCYLSIIELRKEEKDADNVKQPGGSMFYLFNMVATAMGHRHDYHRYGEKPTADGNVRTGQGETTGGDHCQNTIPLLRGMLKEGGFDKVQLSEAPRTDMLDQVHFLCQK